MAWVMMPTVEVVHGVVLVRHGGQTPYVQEMPVWYARALALTIMEVLPKSLDEDVEAALAGG
jgi:hypothetical protein